MSSISFCRRKKVKSLTSSEERRLLTHQFIIERVVIQRQIDEEVERIEFEQAIQQRKEYIHFVTSEIMQHIIDMGITIFFPHVMKEAYRKTSDIADKMELTCKDRKIVKMKPEYLEILHYDIENPLPDDVIEYIYTKEFLIFLWKLGETDTRSPEEVLKIFHKAIADPGWLSFKTSMNCSQFSMLQ